MLVIAPACTTIATVAVVLGVRRHRPRARAAWRLVALAMALSAIAGWTGVLVLRPLYFVAELMLAGALLVLVRARGRSVGGATLIDGAIIALGFAAVSWAYLLGPYTSAAGPSRVAAAWAPVVSGADVLLVASAALLVLGARPRTRSALLLTGAVAALVASHLLFAWSVRHGGTWLDTLTWVAFCALLAGSALVPSMRLLSEPAEPAGRDDSGLTRARLALFAATSLVAPAAAIVQAVLHRPSHLAVSVASGLVFVLVLARIGVLLREHEALTEASLRSRFEARLGSLVRNSSDVVSIVDTDGVVQYISPAALRLLGLQEHEATAMDWWEFVHADDQPALHAFLAGLLPGASGEVEYRVRVAGGWLDVETLATNLVGDGAVEGIVLNTRDVSDRKALERRLLHQASHDALTGLPNRALLRDRVGQALARRRRSGESVAVIFLDLDDFKAVNDTLGHAAGDAVLQEVARRLDGCIRASDTATRLGGDEFAVLVADMSDESDAVAIAERILDALTRPMEIDARTVEATGSLGIAFAGDGREAADDLLGDADAAMYLAKERGKGSYAIFEPAMHAAAVARLELKGALSRAVADGDVRLVYQPVVDLRTGEIRAYEALARWTHPERGEVSPGEFIGLAEETGLIVALGRDLLFRACRQAAAFQAAVPDGEPLRISVNVSARQLAAEGFAADVSAAVAAAGIRPSDVVLELTESAIMSDFELAVARTTELRALGVRLAVDDFGTGYSSLNSLRGFPIDRLKIDKSFLRGVADDHRTRALTAMMVELGELLDMVVVAEGIEDAAQLRAVLDLGCCFGQGFLLGRPAPAGDVLASLARDGRRIALPAPARPSG